MCGDKHGIGSPVHSPHLLMFLHYLIFLHCLRISWACCRRHKEGTQESCSGEYLDALKCLQVHNRAAERDEAYRKLTDLEEEKTSLLMALATMKNKV